MAVPWQMLVDLGIKGMSEYNARAEQDKARALLEKQRQRFEDINLPDETAIDPVLIDQLDPADPALLAARKAALARLAALVDNGGLMLEDEVAMNKLAQQAELADTRSRQAMANEFEARGQLGSGAQLAVNLANQQASGMRSAEAGRDRAAMAQRRALQAIVSGADLAGSMSADDFREREARSAINRFNAGATERSRYYNAQGGQRRFDNEMRRTGAQSGATGALYSDHQSSAADTRAFGSSMGAAANRYLSGQEDEDEPRYDWEDDPYYHRRSPSRLGGEDDDK